MTVTFGSDDDDKKDTQEKLLNEKYVTHDLC